VKLLEGVVRDLTHDGRGVVRVEDKVYFVEGALPGEKIEFVRLRRHRKHEIGKLEAIIEPASDRVSAPCQYFGVCGGCALQHLDPESQIATKQKTLIDNLERLGHVQPGEILEPLVGPATGYRRKARLGTQYVPKKGGVQVGFRERNKTCITSLDQCLAMHPSASRLLPDLHVLVAGLSCYQKLPQIEVACADSHVALVFRHLDPFTEDDLATLRNFAQTNDADVYLQPGGLHTVVCLEPPQARPLLYSLPEFDVTIQFEPTDFIQVNGDLNALMIKRGVDLLQCNKDDCVLELFCGIGNFSLPIATRAAHVIAVEANVDLVTRGRSNAERNGIENVEFCVANLYTEQIGDLKARQFNKLFIDPPRTGALEVVRDLVPRTMPERIVYVSCNPATLARDSDILVNQHGYTLECCGVMDMFPHTAHVESIAVFSR